MRNIRVSNIRQAATDGRHSHVLAFLLEGEQRVFRPSSLVVDVIQLLLQRRRLLVRRRQLAAQLADLQLTPMHSRLDRRERRV